MISHDLFRRSKQTSSEQLHESRAKWEVLKAENADLRVLTPSGLISAPLSYFDPLIISLVTTEWRRCARVVGESLFRSGNDGFRQTGDLVLWSRLRTLMEDGVLEGRGNLLEMHESWVRRNRPAISP
jgi:hypothetical protein